MSDFKICGVIAAVRGNEEFEKALLSDAEIIFDLSPDILNLSEKIKTAHNAGKRFFIHIDLACGIGKDRSGILYAKNAGADGIISTRVNIIKMARDIGLFTVQRFFIVDSRSVDTTVEAISASHADMIEVMPGVVSKIIEELKNKINVPIIAGGLIETSDEVSCAVKSGAYAVSTGTPELWSLSVNK